MNVYAALIPGFNGGDGEADGDLKSPICAIWQLLL
jgi:hypothetical protein